MILIVSLHLFVDIIRWSRMLVTRNGNDPPLHYQEVKALENINQNCFPLFSSAAVKDVGNKLKVQYSMSKFG